MTEAALKRTTAELQIDDTTDATEDAALPSVRVIDAVEAATGEDPMEMAPLYHAVDTDALDNLIASDVDGHVCFDFNGHVITVHGDGRILVDGSEQGGA